MKRLLFFAMLTATSRGGFGQLMSTSERVDSLLIAQFVENSGAILDSLTRFEFAKLYIKQYKVEIDECKNFRTKLLLDNAYMSGTAAASQKALYRTQLLYEQKSERFKKANRERWIWRVGAAALIYFQIVKPNLPP